MNRKVVKNTKFNKLNTKANKLDRKIPHATTLIYINQYKADIKNLEKKLEMLIKIPDVSDLVTRTVLNKKFKEVDKKYLTLVV